jgi:hypothetical protein
MSNSKDKGLPEDTARQIAALRQTWAETLLTDFLDFAIRLAQDPPATGALSSLSVWSGNILNRLNHL